VVVGEKAHKIVELQLSQSLHGNAEAEGSSLKGLGRKMAFVAAAAVILPGVV